MHQLFGVARSPLACRGQYGGSEEERLAVLGLAQDLGAPYVDVELKAAPAFSASRGVSCLPCVALPAQKCYPPGCRSCPIVALGMYHIEFAERLCYS